jgi:hypothetical protein
MSPLRVLIQYPDGVNKVVQTILSKDKITHKHVIYLAEKRMILGQEGTPLSPRNIAYRIVTTKNSDIIRKYDIYTSYDNREKYQISGVPGKYYTLNECFNACINSYCSETSSRIIQIF